MSSTDSGSFVGAFVDVPVNEMCRSLTQALIDGDNTAHVFIPMDQMALKNMATKFNQLYQMTCLQSESESHSPEHHHNKERKKDNSEESLIEDASPIDAISSPNNDFGSLCNTLEEIDDDDILLQDSDEDVFSTTSNVEYELQPNLTEVRSEIGLLGDISSEPLNEAEKTESLVSDNVSYESEEESIWNADENNNTYKENKPLETADSVCPKVDHVKRDSITFTQEEISSLAKLFVNELFSSDLLETLSSQPKVPVVPDVLSESKDIPVSQSKLKGTETQVNASNKTDDKSLVEDRIGQFEGLRYHDIRPVSDDVEISNCIDGCIGEQTKSKVTAFSNMEAHRRKNICSPLIGNKSIAIATINSTLDNEALSTNPESCSTDGIHASNKKVITIPENTNTARKQSHACLPREDSSRSDSVHIQRNAHHASRTLHTEEDGCALSNNKIIKAAKQLLPFDEKLRISVRKKRKIYEVEKYDDTEIDKNKEPFICRLHQFHPILITHRNDAASQLQAVKRHLFDCHLPWFLLPHTACWTCSCQFFTKDKLHCHQISAIHHSVFDFAKISKWCRLMDGVLRILRLETKSPNDILLLKWVEDNIGFKTQSVMESHLLTFFEEAYQWPTQSGLYYNYQNCKGIGAVLHWEVLYEIMKKLPCVSRSRFSCKIPTFLDTTHMLGDNNIYVDSFCCRKGSNASRRVAAFGEKYVPVVSYTSPNSWSQVKDRKLWQHKFYFTVGFHPLHLASKQFCINQHKKELKRYVTDKRCIGFTAVGLDYYSGITIQAKKAQRRVFNEMITLAIIYKTPLSIYATGVGAQEDVLSFLNNHLSRKHPLCVHYTGESKEEIGQWLNLFPDAKFAVSSSILDHAKHHLEDNSLRYIEMTKLLVESSDPTKVCDLNFNPMLIKEF